MFGLHASHNAFQSAMFKLVAKRPIATVLVAPPANERYYQVEDDTEILIRYNVWGRGPKFWTST